MTLFWMRFKFLILIFCQRIVEKEHYRSAGLQGASRCYWTHLIPHAVPKWVIYSHYQCWEAVSEPHSPGVMKFLTISFILFKLSLYYFAFTSALSSCSSSSYAYSLFKPASKPKSYLNLYTARLNEPRFQVSKRLFIPGIIIHTQFFSVIPSLKISDPN